MAITHSELAKKGLEQGLITKNQYDKLPPKLLDAIVKSKMKKNVSKNGKKPAPKGGKKSGK